MFGTGSLFLISLVSYLLVNDVKTIIISDEKLRIIKEAQMDEKQYERVHNLHLNWYTRAINSLMGAVGREMFLKMNRDERSKFLHCLDQIRDDHDLQAGAKCLVACWDKSWPQDSNGNHKPTYEPTKPIGHLKSIIIRRKTPPPSNALSLKESPRLKRLRQRVDRIPGLEAHANHYRTQVQRREYQRRRKRRDVHLIDQEDKITKNEYLRMFSEFDPTNMATAPDLIGTPKTEPKSPVRQLTNLFTNILHSVDQNNSRISPWKQSYAQLNKLNKMISQSKNEQNYRHRMVDYVTDFDERYRKKVPFMSKFKNLVPERQNMPKVLRGAYELVDTLTNYTDILNTRILSPKIGSIINDQRTEDTL